jgi:hypothetical protein
LQEPRQHQQRPAARQKRQQNSRPPLNSPILRSSRRPQTRLQRLHQAHQRSSSRLGPLLVFLYTSVLLHQHADVPHCLPPLGQVQYGKQSQELKRPATSTIADLKAEVGSYAACSSLLLGDRLAAAQHAPISCASFCPACVLSSSARPCVLCLLPVLQVEKALSIPPSMQKLMYKGLLKNDTDTLEKVCCFRGCSDAQQHTTGWRPARGGLQDSTVPSLHVSVPPGTILCDRGLA